MRGDDLDTSDMFSYLSPEHRIPKDHPLRPLRRMVLDRLAEEPGLTPVDAPVDAVVGALRLAAALLP